jgi:magnesium-transporting ATPase (P-type)
VTIICLLCTLRLQISWEICNFTHYSTDKTGTLTCNKMVLRTLLIDGEKAAND